jgi:UDP-N-acetylglucosamine 4-epimerase
VLSVVEQSAGVKIDVTWGEKSAADIPVAYANISKAKAVLGWEPHYSIQQGICNTLSYYKENSDDYK